MLQLSERTDGCFAQWDHVIRGRQIKIGLTFMTRDEVRELGSDGHGGVIWITGFSAAGKTTIGRRVEASLRTDGWQTVFLDGDDLRAIFGSNWGYEREQRVELSRIYFRLCSHLASHGVTVVISAVCMYEEIYHWVKENIPRSVQVYIDVPENERRRRDEKTKNVYNMSKDFSVMYDVPLAPDLHVKNVGEKDPKAIADRVIEYFKYEAVTSFDMGRKSYWNGYYEKVRSRSAPSPFAKYVLEKVDGQKNVLEVGCGEGRDAIAFAGGGHKVTALDRSVAAIERCKQEYAASGIQFTAGVLPEHANLLNGQFDLIYSRFTLHAMPLEEEKEFLAAAYRALKEEGDIFIECRSINDPLSRKGDVISPTERICGHYRRFLILDDLIARLSACGFRSVDTVESTGLAPFGEEDPVVIRVIGRKV